MYHFPNYIDVVIPYTHIRTHTVLVHDNQYENYCIIQIPTLHSNTTDIRLISVHVMRKELQVFMGSAARGQQPPGF